LEASRKEEFAAGKKKKKITAVGFKPWEGQRLKEHQRTSGFKLWEGQRFWYEA